MYVSPPFAFKHKLSYQMVRWKLKCLGRVPVTIFFPAHRCLVMQRLFIFLLSTILRSSLATDFDFTMTKFWVNGRRGASCHMVISESGLLSEEFHARTAKLRAHYYPIEVQTAWCCDTSFLLCL